MHGPPALLLNFQGVSEGISYMPFPEVRVQQEEVVVLGEATVGPPYRQRQIPQGGKCLRDKSGEDEGQSAGVRL